MTRSKLLPILALTILLASTLVGCGQTSVTPPPLAVLTAAVGDVSVMKGSAGSWAGAQVGMSLKTGDGIKTGDSSTAEITFLDGSTIDLEANTEIDIVALDISSATGSKTITLNQIIGDTISRVTHLVDPESRYEIDTPTGVAGVRGTVMLVHVGEDGTTLVTNQEGDVYTIAQGVLVEVPVGQTCIMAPGEPPNLMPVAADDFSSTLERHRITIPVLDNDFDPDAGDTLTVSSVALPIHGSVENNGNDVTYIPDPDFHDTDSFTYTISDGRGGTDTATVTINVAIVETFADINVSLESGSAPIYIWDEASDWWAIDENTDTGYEINGIHHETTMTIAVAAGRRYYVWLQAPGTSYYVTGYPSGWTVASSPVGGYDAAYGYAAATGEVPYWVSFAISE
jgi:hypothetical protein